jgi:SAM-dependent methyltransferase
VCGSTGRLKLRLRAGERQLQRRPPLRLVPLDRGEVTPRTHCALPRVVLLRFDGLALEAASHAWSVPWVFMPSTPSPWLCQHVDLIPRDRPVLDVAAGQGRHALFLAAKGWAVHAVDRDVEALAALSSIARSRDLAVTTAVCDLEQGEAALGVGRYGAVVVFNYLHRPLMPALVDAVGAGGVLIYETFTSGQAQRGRPRNPAFLLADGELPALVSPLDVWRWEEGERDGNLVASIVARRRAGIDRPDDDRRTADSGRGMRAPGR